MTYRTFMHCTFIRWMYYSRKPMLVIQFDLKSVPLPPRTERMRKQFFTYTELSSDRKILLSWIYFKNSNRGSSLVFWSIGQLTDTLLIWWSLAWLPATLIDCSTGRPLIWLIPQLIDRWKMWWLIVFLYAAGVSNGRLPGPPAAAAVWATGRLRQRPSHQNWEPPGRGRPRSDCQQVATQEKNRRVQGSEIVAVQ